MGNEKTKYSIQELFNYAVDDTVKPPQLTIGLMVWNGSAWVRWNPNGTFLRLDGNLLTYRSRGITSNTSEVITAGNTYDLNINVGSGFSRGKILIRRQTGVLNPSDFCIIWCTATASQGHSYSRLGSSNYSVSYSMAQGDSYLSHQVFSSTTDGIRVSEAYINGSNLLITFFNALGTSKTLNAYIDWEVWK